MPIGVTIILRFLVSILLTHACLLPLKFQLLIALLLDHVVGTLIQTHAPLLCFDLVLDQTGKSLWVWSRSSRRGGTNTGHSVVLLAELLNFGVIAAPAN